MQVSLSLATGLLVGTGLYLATRSRPAVAMWTALLLGAAGSALLVGSINGWLFPDLGRIGAIGFGLLSGTATVLAVGCVGRGERRPLNWVALVVSAAPVLFLIAFGIGELVGPSH